jgi:hypothetical protein
MVVVAACGVERSSPSTRNVSASRPTGQDLEAYAGGIPHSMRIASVNLAPTVAEITAAVTLYVAIYPLNPKGRRDLGALRLASGYRPQCDPCFHPGLPLPLVYHDHIFAGTLGSETGGSMIWVRSQRHPIAVMYDPTWIGAKDFEPLRTAEQLKAAERAGHLLPINKAGTNPYELPQNTVVTIDLQTHAQ